MDPKPRAPGYVRWVVETLEEAGYETWTVGGAIRNTLLGLPAGDWDLTTRAPPHVVQKLFPRTVPVGVEHGTVGVLARNGVLLEVTTFRKDVETSGRHAAVEFADTLAEDLARRDFTVNAVAWHPIREEYQDPFSGRKDLKAGILRTVGVPRERFSEDYLRVLRALRFSGRFKLRIGAETWKALCECVDRLGHLSPERIREELLKVLTEDDTPSGALALYAESGVLEVLYPELAEVKGCSRPGRDEDLWDHSIHLTDRLSRGRPVLRLAALFHGVGEPGGRRPAGGESVGDGPQDSSSGTGDRARERAAALLVRGRYSNLEVQEVSELIGIGLEPPLDLSDPPALRRWLHRADPHRLRSFGRIWLGKARLDQLHGGLDPSPVLELLRRFRSELSAGPPLRTRDLALTGRDLIGLGLRPGPRFGEILDEMMDHVLEDPTLNNKERLVELVEAAGYLKDAGE
jgi:hypothetical protein